jgi:hypothetical protein
MIRAYAIQNEAGLYLGRNIRWNLVWLHFAKYGFLLPTADDTRAAALIAEAAVPATVVPVDVPDDWAPYIGLCGEAPARA